MNASTQPDPQTSGISHWPDTDSIDARLKALIRQPIRPIRREHMDKVHGYFEQQCQGSKRLAEQAVALGKQSGGWCKRARSVAAQASRQGADAA